MDLAAGGESTMVDANQFKIARWKMVREQLYRRGIGSRRVLAAIYRVPRERFVPGEYRGEAYADRALPIACGQTISQPYRVALMTRALDLHGTEHVLEIGTGSGYQTAVLARLARSVVSVERFDVLSRQAAAILDELGHANVKLVVGDGTEGWPEDAPYDRIIVTAAATKCPPALFEQLREGGNIVLPIGDANEQELQRIRKVNGEPEATILTGCRFVPLIGAFCPE
jgi:protein-L-isoaspartate(D-aspartate) O-methyltransferase